MTNKYYQNAKKYSEKKDVKDIKSFLKKKKTKGKKWSETDIKVFLKDKQKLLEYMKNYYLAHKKVAI